MAATWKSKITRHRVAAFAVAAGLGIAACSPGGASSRYSASPAPISTAAVPAGGLAKVGITNFAFDPAALTVKAGTKVIWTNNDAVAHTVAFTDVASSPVLNRGDSFSRTFTSAGTYSYIYSIHPFMHGTVVVTP